MIGTAALKAGLQRWCDDVQRAAPELNELDGRLGDGDLGTTLDKCAANVRDALPGMPDTLSCIFKACAAACAKASGSSFGTLLAVAFMTAAKQAVDTESLTRAQTVAMLDAVTASLCARGGAALGDKTMLDSIDAVARALDAAGDAADLRPVTARAAAAALDAFRNKPNKIGRARMFADRSIGMDDPGMVAISKMAQSLQGPSGQ